MSNVPSKIEKQELENLAKAGGYHFKLLLAWLSSITLLFLVPQDYQVAILPVAGVLLILVGISFVNLQFFQSCPRCGYKINQVLPNCGDCGLNLRLRSTKGDGSEWTQ
jgi:hypothetical protein